MMEARSRIKQFTGRELSRLNQRHNIHVAYAGKVYDASGFLEKHPGGCEQLMLGAGRDITQLFRSYHKPETAKLIGDKCKYVGDLVDNEMPAFLQSEGEFFRTVQMRVTTYFRSNGLDPKVDMLTFCRYTTFAMFSLLLWYMCITYHASCWTLATFFAAASGFMCAWWP